MCIFLKHFMCPAEICAPFIFLYVRKAFGAFYGEPRTHARTHQSNARALAERKLVAPKLIGEQ